MPIKKAFHSGKGELHAHAQKMADGTFGPGGVAILHLDSQGFTEVYRLPLEGPYFQTEEAAAQFALERLVKWLDENYPPK